MDYTEKKYAREMTYLLKEQVATGEFAWAPSFGVVEENNEEDDVYIPTFDHLDIHNNEGSGDSEDPTIGAKQPGDSIGLNTMNLNTSSQGTRSTRIGEKRKSEGRRGKVKKGGTDSVSIIGQHLQTVATASSHTSAFVARTQDDQTSINKASEILHSIPNIFNNIDFYLNCQSVLMNKELRMWFITCPTVEVQLAFLRKHMGNM